MSIAQDQMIAEQIKRAEMVRQRDAYNWRIARPRGALTVGQVVEPEARAASRRITTSFIVIIAATMSGCTSVDPEPDPWHRLDPLCVQACRQECSDDEPCTRKCIATDCALGEQS